VCVCVWVGGLVSARTGRGDVGGAEARACAEQSCRPTHLHALADEAGALLGSPDGAVAQQARHGAAGEAAELQAADGQRSAAGVSRPLLSHQVKDQPACDALFVSGVVACVCLVLSQ
jgi:hypothetical protein